MAKILCEFCLKSKADWRCVDCGTFLCNSHVDKKFSLGRFITKGAFTVATAGLGVGSFAVGKGTSKNHKCIRCGSTHIKKL